MRLNGLLSCEIPHKVVPTESDCRGLSATMDRPASLGTVDSPVINAGVTMGSVKAAKRGAAASRLTWDMFFLGKKAKITYYGAM
jgi:hypothetical protein